MDVTEVVDGVKNATLSEEPPKQEPPKQKQKAPKAKKSGNASGDAKPLEVGRVSRD